MCFVQIYTFLIYGEQDADFDNDDDYSGYNKQTNLPNK